MSMLKPNLWICQKTEFELGVHGKEVGIGSDSGDDDYSPLSSLEFLHRPHGNGPVFPQIPSKRISNLFHLKQNA